MEFKKLFEPVTINKMKLKNRIVMPPMHTRFASEFGEATDQIVDFYVERAKGGVGLIIIENTCVDWIFGRAAGNPIRIDDDIFTSGLHTIVEEVQKYGVKIATQLQHTGRQNDIENIEGHQSPIAPSAIPCTFTKDTPVEMTLKDIHRVIEQFVEGAKRTKVAGFDAVELHGAHGYIFTQFMSPYSNKRTDLYGGSLENRMRFTVEVVRKVREEVGSDFPIIFRFSGEEKLPGGITLEDSLYMVRLLEEEGVDAFHVSAGAYDSITWLYPDEEGQLLYLAEAVKKVTKLPVITVGRLGTNPELAEKVLKEGKADLVSMGRSLLADPYIPLKIKAGKTEDICPCIACNECAGREFNGWKLACAINPLLGKEYKIHSFRQKTSPKKVMIVGAGPAGLEAARVAKLNGHEVEVFEKRSRVGGQLIEAAAASYKKSHFEPLLSYYEAQIKKLGIKVRLEKEITSDEIIKSKPDIVVIATGATPIIPNIPGIKGDNVYLAMDYLVSEQASYFGNKNIKRIDISSSKKVCIIGGGEVGLEAAYILGKKGNDVTVVEMAEELFRDLNLLQIEYTKSRVKEANTKIIKNNKVKEIKKGKVLIENSKFEESEIEADIVIIAVGSVSNNSLVDKLEGKVPEIKVIGDATKVARIIQAVHDGFNVVYQFSDSYEKITLPFIKH